MVYFKGDKVSLNGHEAIVTKVSWDYYGNTESVTIEFDNRNLIPPVWELDKYLTEKLVLISRTLGKSSTRVTCNCGAKHTSFPNYHYDWCDRENKK